MPDNGGDGTHDLSQVTQQRLPNDRRRLSTDRWWKIGLLILAIVAVLFSGATLISKAGSSRETGPQLTHTIERGNLLISVIERTKEFGILKASGWSNANIIGSVVLQSITVGLMGALAGLAIGYGAGQAIDQYLDAEIAIITVRLVVIIGVFGMAVGLVGGLYPAVRAARVSPIDSLRAL